MFRMCSLMVLCMVSAALVSHAADTGADIPGNEPVSHSLHVRLHPEEHRLDAEDRITVPESFGHSFSFVLHKSLVPVSSTPDVSIVRESETEGEVPLVRYRVTLPAGLRTWELAYQGEISHHLEPNEKETARGSLGTTGLISKEGTFLAQESHWYPQFGEGLLTFDLEVTVPREWDAVSQGARTLHEVRDDVRQVRWHCPNPQEGIVLVAGRWVEYVRSAGKIQTMVFLREPDADLADKYLTATARYVEFYDRLIGPYPYEKFALVENFWETGYGMPSFTLMGPKVIRFPFIIASSYPHEILHNWWGNSVYPDLHTGNWCEGLTAYLADYLLAAQRGRAMEYRRDTLQRYTDYVSKTNDIALCQFRSRHSAATQAIGYGKALMFFHMLRLDLGDDAFRSGLRNFFHSNIFQIASYDDIRRSIEAVSGKTLTSEFTQWVTKPGAPQLKASHPAMVEEGDRYAASVVLEQTQPEDVYRLRIPVAVTMKGQDNAYQDSVLMTERRQEFRFAVPHVPVRLDVDPQFDVFRRLAQEEVPPALTQVFSAKRLAIVLPKDADPGLTEAFSRLARDWHASGPDLVESFTENQMHALPTDSAVLILGWKNRFAAEVLSRLSRHHVTVTRDRVAVGERSFPRNGLSAIFVVRNPHDPSLAIMWLATDVKEAVNGLARKLPHYQGYSYLMFQGTEPSNVLKGKWPVLDSPMTLFVPQPDGSIERIARGKLARRSPLAVFPGPAHSDGKGRP